MSRVAEMNRPRNPTNLNSDDALAILGGKVADAVDDLDEHLQTAKRLASEVSAGFDSSFDAARQAERLRLARYASLDLTTVLGKLTGARYRLVRRVAEYAAEAGYPLEL